MIEEIMNEITRKLVTRLDIFVEHDHYTIMKGHLFTTFHIFFLKELTAAWFFKNILKTFS